MRRKILILFSMILLGLSAERVWAQTGQEEYTYRLQFKFTADRLHKLVKDNVTQIRVRCAMHDPISNSPSGKAQGSVVIKLGQKPITAQPHEITLKTTSATAYYVCYADEYIKAGKAVKLFSASKGARGATVLKPINREGLSLDTVLLKRGRIE